MNALSKLQGRSDRVYMGGIVLLGTILRFWDIAKSSIWHDEGFTLMLSQRGFDQIIERTAHDVHPPLYYLVMHIWINLFGVSELAVRSLSALCMLAAIPLTFAVMTRLWDRRAAWLSALFVATGPLLIRYSQEARMYGMVTLLTIAATYLLLRAFESNRWGWWLGYSATVAAALYTHYYAIFVVVAHALYAIAISGRAKRSGVLNPRWWVANTVAAAAFLPWLPTLVRQVSRVTGAFWIPEVQAYTIPNTLLQFLSFNNYDFVTTAYKVIIGVLFIALVGWLYYRYPRRRPTVILLGVYCVLAPMVIFTLSLGTPIYVDRYFTFCSLAFFCLLAIGISRLRGKALGVATMVVLIFAGIGSGVVWYISDHAMRQTAAYVGERYRPGDVIVSGELYAYFDFTHYNTTGSEMKILSNPYTPYYGLIDDYGESSLVYDRASKIVVSRLDQVQPTSGRVWLVGKTKFQSYYFPPNIPINWKPVGPYVTRGYTAVQAYEVTSRR